MSTPGASKIRSMDLSVLTAYAHFVFEDTSRAGCGLLLPRIAFSQKMPSRRQRWDFPGFVAELEKTRNLDFAPVTTLAHRLL